MSGSTILYVAAGLFATIFYGLRGFFYRFVNFWKGRGFVSEDSIKDCSIVFYSEGKQYWNVFLPIIQELDSKGVKSAYLSSDNNDPGLEYESGNLYTHYLGGMAQSWSYLNNLKADLVVMTTPQLDIMTLKKSKNVKHYCHVLHSPSDVHTYRKFAFDYFDSVICSGPYQVKAIRELEKVRGSHKKELFKSGLTYFDVMVKEIDSNIESDKPVVLIAPTWQPFCILNRFGEDLINELLKESKYHVILRPHPQSYVSFPDVVKNIEHKFGSNSNFEIDKNASGASSLARADVMISDISGVVFDFAFVYEKPVILFDVPFEGLGMEKSNISWEPWDVSVRDKMGALLKEENLKDINTTIDSILSSPVKTQLKSFRDESVYNYGKAGAAAAQDLLNILRNIKC